MRMDELRQGFNTLWDSMADGWDRLRHAATGALTRFTPGETTDMPRKGDVDDAVFMPGQGWAMLGGDVYEDETRLLVRLEAPGMEKADFDVEVMADKLVIRGEKRFEREATEGRWRVVQCAYGSFSRSVPLPTSVRGDEATATYRNGVLRVELPKQQPGTPRRTTVNVS